MPTQDTSELKARIISVLRTKGPGLPVHIARATNLSILFASAFLSELLSENKIKISHMKVGNSPIYFIQGQEPLLERYAHHLNSKEKEAYVLLKEKKFLRDIKQQPAIRVALREIKDFAIPFKQDEEIIWRFFTIPMSEFKEPKKLTQLIALNRGAGGRAPSKELGIFDKSKTKKSIIKKPKKKSSKINEKFFNKIKEDLAKKQIEILDIIEFSKGEIILKIKSNEQESLLVAYNKKRITEKEIIKAYKKAQKIKLPYTIFCLGEQTKKLTDFLQATKQLKDIIKLE